MGWGHEGRTTTPEQEAKERFPPKYAHLLLQVGAYEAAFCDSRKFGKSELRADTAPLDQLAADAWQGPAASITDSLTQKSTPIKALLLDQKRACSGVGNWVADEVLYQCHMHPNQNFLTVDEASRLVQRLQSILGTAVDCLARHVPYPADWLFGYRWTKKKAGNDAQGLPITFCRSGGRTTAMIASQQILDQRKKRPVDEHDEPNRSGKKRVKEPVEDETESKPKRGKKKPSKNREGTPKSTSRKRAKQAPTENQTDGSGEKESSVNEKQSNGNGRGRTKRPQSKPVKEESESTSATDRKAKKGTTTKTRKTPLLEAPSRRSPRFVSP